MSLSEIIETWAPPVENQTDKYFDFVLGEMRKVYPAFTGENIVSDDQELLILFKAMTKFENGLQPYSDELILNGIQLA